MSPLLRLFAAATLALALVASNAVAADWDPFVTVAPAVAPGPSGLNSAISPAVASDGTGNLTAVWAGDGKNGYGIYSSTRAPSAAASWSAPTRVGAALPNPGPQSLRLAVSTTGHAVAGWIAGVTPASETQPQTQTITASTRTPNGSWSAPSSLPTTPGDQYSAHELTIADDGQPVSLFGRDVDYPVLSLGTLTTSPSGSVVASSGPSSSTVLTQASPLAIDIDAAGTATAIYTDALGPRLLTATRPTGGAWTAPTALDAWTPPAGASDPVIAFPALGINRAGRAVATWVRTSFLGTSELLSAVRDGGSWSSSTVLETLSDQAAFSASSVGIDERGQATAAWAVSAFQFNDDDTTTFSAAVRSRSAPATGVWSAAEDRSPRLEITPPRDATDTVPPAFSEVGLSVGDGGSTALVWLARQGGTAKVQGAVRVGGGSWEPWTPLEDLPSAMDNPPSSISFTAVTVSPLGQATAIWAFGRNVRARSVVLTPLTDPAAPTDPAPIVPTPTDATPTDPGPTAPVVASATPTPVSPTPAVAETPKPKLVIAMYVVPSGRKCPARAVATVAKVRSALTVKASKIRGKLRCKVTGTIVLAPATKAGTKVSVLVTAKGIKRKTVQFPTTL